MKPIITLSLVLLISSLVPAFSNAQTLKHCDTDNVKRKLLAEHPEYAIIDQQLEMETAQPSSQSQPAMPPVYIIPVVFHIIHDYGVENISDAQVIDAIRQMNEDFRKLNADLSSLDADFTGIAADCEIEFRLATKAPDGSCTNGIDRVQSILTYAGGDDAKLNGWPRNKYLNIWTVKEFNADHASAAAYSMYPAFASSAEDGIISLHDYVGFNGTSTSSRRHTLTHEVGHYLNLKHVWGDSNSPGVACDDDNVSDTPETMGWTSCNLTSNDVCNAGTEENVQNFMEYSPCTNMFSAGQRTRMRSALTSSVASRNNLWTSSNLTATGALASPQPVCKPIADFNASPAACVGATVQFTDRSFNGTPSSWSWAFTGGTPATASVSNPGVTYSAPGVYAVTLTATNNSGNTTKTKTAYITVLDASQAYDTPIVQGFEDISLPDNNLMVLNPDGDETWEKTNASFSSGNFSMKMNNYTGGAIGQVETLISPLFDFSTGTANTLTFKLAHAMRNTSDNTDKLVVSVSTNCGATWSARYTKYGSNLANAGIKSNGAFVPSSSQWRTETVTITPYINSSNVRIKFEFTSSGNGNNIYIDDINIDGFTGISDESGNLSDLNIYPNPFSNEALISFNMVNSGLVSCTLIDVLGREFTVVPEQAMNSGEQKFVLKPDVAAGIYILRLNIAGKISSRKIAVQ